MVPNHEYWLEVDEQGRLVLPAEVMEHYGIRPGAQIRMKEGSKSLRIHRPVTQLTKVYVELTSRCNLTCRTCIRNAWKEAQGDMTGATFRLLLEGLKNLPSRPEVFFGGFGEPLLLADIAEKVAEVKAVAGKVELITNGILLSEQLSHELIVAGLDTLWVSVDGATPEHYADVRLGAALPTVFDNIIRFSNLRNSNNPHPEIGISFVAMRKNVADLPLLIRMSSRLGATRYMVTNVFPYTEEMCKEMLYTRSLDGVELDAFSMGAPHRPAAYGSEPDQPGCRGAGHPLPEQCQPQWRYPGTGSRPLSVHRSQFRCGWLGWSSQPLPAADA